MNKRNSLSHTKIMPAIRPDPDASPRTDAARLHDTKEYRIAGSVPHYHPVQRPPAANRPVHPQERRPAPQQRPRVQQPPDPIRAPIRRASYQERLPDEDQSLPRRRSDASRRSPEYDEPAKKQSKKKKKNKKKRHGCVFRSVTGILTSLAILFALYSAAAVLAIKRIRYEETYTRSLTASLAEEDADVRNILIIGTDSRNEERGRADTMIVLSFSRHNKSVTMTSLLRDSYVSIPGHGTDKLNAAYAYGGATLLMDTVVNNFGIPIDEYVCVNFKAFVHIADALGGLKLTVSDREAEAINVILESEVNGIMGDEPTDDFLPSGGTFVLNGKQALAYTRIRYVGNADYERTERQRTVLDQILHKLKHPNPAAIPRILYSAMPELSTNINGVNMYLLSLEMPVKLIAYDMQKLRLPADGTFSDQTAPDGQMVLAVDFDKNHQIFIDTVTEPLPTEEPESEVQP